MLAHWLCYFNSAINPVIYNFMSCTYLLQLSYISAINLSTPSYTASWAVRISYNFPTSVPSTYQPRHIQLHELYVSLTTFLHQCHQPINPVIYNFMSCTYLLQLSYINPVIKKKLHELYVYTSYDFSITPSYIPSRFVRISYNFSITPSYVTSWVVRTSYDFPITPSYVTPWAVLTSYNFPTARAGHNGVC